MLERKLWMPDNGTSIDANKHCGNCRKRLIERKYKNGKIVFKGPHCPEATVEDVGNDKVKITSMCSGNANIYPKDVIR